ncbi:hypothetical protein HPP92_006447 [Vanilla planifolia]|uniref:CASP-like protein n=1 Tax=Vanilla planifolia TaxID=51239 RepID=A0A835RPN3_VANPL|nr:hypothetical protein HPP92_006447 [Vanilla planifolia]
MENRGSGLTQKKFVMLQLLLRPLSALFSVVAALVMVLSKETRDLTGHQMTASYSISPELRFFVVGNFLSCGYALLSLPLVSIPANSFIVYVLDLIVIIDQHKSRNTSKFRDEHGTDSFCSLRWDCNRLSGTDGWNSAPSSSPSAFGEIAMGFSFVGLFLFLLSCFLSQICAIKRLKKEQQKQNNNRI